MNELPRNQGDFFPNNNAFDDSPQYKQYEHTFSSSLPQPAYSPNWGLNTSGFVNQSRASGGPYWPDEASHLSHHHQSPHLANHVTSPYAPQWSQTEADFARNNYSHPTAYHNDHHQQPQYNSSLASPHIHNQNPSYSSADVRLANAGTIAPLALQHHTKSPAISSNSPDGAFGFAGRRVGEIQQSVSTSSPAINPANLVDAIPKGTNAGRFSIITFDELVAATNSERMGSFVAIGKQTREWNVNRAALPTYVPRKSRHELRKLAGTDPKLLAKLSKVAKKERTSLVTSGITVPGSGPNGERIKYENDSSSEEESSSSDEEGSSYTSDDEGEVSPLPAKRPEGLKEATEYDTIKALWRPKRKSIGSESIRKGLGEFWEIVKTIRDRWKLDVSAVQEAEVKKRTNELPLLQSRVKDQRDMMEVAFKTALKHGHRVIVELMAENLPLIFLCYQFLLDRTKVDDYNGSLARVMLETMALFTTITDEKLEKTHMVKVLPRYIKKGDAKTQFHARRIIAKASTASKEVTKDVAPKQASAAELNSPGAGVKRVASEATSGVKRPASTVAEGGVQKKAATTSAKSSGGSAGTQKGPLKKPLIATDNSKASVGPTTIVKPKQVVAKPSGLFSSLQSAAKKPGTSIANRVAQTGSTIPSAKPPAKIATSTSGGQTVAPQASFSFAETMANLSKPKEEKPAPKPEQSLSTETPQEKAKRLRKESRRHLHVQWKDNEELVQVKLFHHDPEEELDHDASQMRDISDVGGEGRMFKQQHQMMDVDDEEEAAEEEAKLIEFQSPNPINFSDVDTQERKRNYASCGGGELEPDSPERAVREAYEASTLVVFYARPSDIPANPREPTDPYNGEKLASVRSFGLPEEKWTSRVRQGKAAQNRQYQPPEQQASMQGGAAPAFDLAAFLSQQQNMHQGLAQQAAPANEAVNNILATLKQASQGQGAAFIPVHNAYGSSPSAPSITSNHFTPPASTAPPPAQLDLAAMIAQIQGGQAGVQQGAPPPPMSGFNYPIASYQSPQQTGLFENPERKQWREEGGNTLSRETRQNPVQNPWFKTKVCKYWQEGRCQKGEGCTYKHEE